MTDRSDARGGYAARRARLLARIAELEGVAVAFSGGVDSSVLLHAAHAVLGERAVGVVADSPSLPRRELAEAVRVAEHIGARLEVVRTDEGEDARYRANRGDRCYFCKAALFRVMDLFVRANRIGAMAFGEITDDLLDDRPGARAAREYGVVAPLAEAGFGKDDVRRYAREAGLPVADKPSSACLASRIPIGTEVTPERLARVEAAEAAVKRLGLSVLRVRDHGSRARLEVARDELAFAEARAEELGAALASAGFARFELGVYRSPVDRARAAATAARGR